MSRIRFSNNWRWLVVAGLYGLFLGYVLAVNFPRGTFLTGWDALHPEFNFKVNFERVFTVVWQSNYGVGALVGHGFGSLLPITVVSFLLSLFLPLWAVRPALISCLYAVGGVGVLGLSRYLLKRLWVNHDRLVPIIPWMSLIAAVYYNVNLGTVQQFYLPLEAFVVHYAVLPWLLWLLLKYIEAPSRRTLGWFGLAAFLGSAQGFVPAVFVALCLSLVILASVWVALAHDKRTLVKGWLAILGVFFGVNAYWLVPFGYYVVGNNGDFLTAYNNQISTPDFVAKSESYGTLADTALIKSFYLDGRQPLGVVFESWLGHYSQVLILMLGYGLFGVIVLGWVYLLVKKNKPQWRGLGLVALVVFGFLASSTPPFSWYMRFLYGHSTLFAQVFRTAFTKFGLLMALFYSVFLGVGGSVVASWIVRERRRTLSLVFSGLVLVAAVIVGWPLFWGNLFDRQLKVDIPKAYFEVMDYFNKAPEGRIVELPVECAEGWFTRPWGYYGSGFIWYGIEQPYLSRTFDVWSRYNENFYFEVRYALRQEGYGGLDQVLQKYNVRYVYLDQNLSHCRSEHGVAYQEDLSEYFANKAAYNLAGTFSDEALNNPLQVFVRAETPTMVWSPANYLTTTSTYQESVSRDWLYHTYGTYVESDSRPSVTYPLSGFESQNGERTALPISFDAENYALESVVDTTGTLLIPAYSGSERTLPIEVILREEGRGSTLGTIHPLGPAVAIDGQEVYKMPDLQFGPVGVEALDQLILWVDNIEMVKVGERFIGSLFMGERNQLLAREGESVVLWWSSDEVSDLVAKVQEESLFEVSQGSSLVLRQPKIYDQARYGNYLVGSQLPVPARCSFQRDPGMVRYESGTNDDPLLRLISVNDESCVTVQLEEMRPADGYVFRLKGEHVSGMLPRLRLVNWRGIVYSDGFGLGLEHDQEEILVVPPVFSKDLGYSFEVSNVSWGKQATVNDLDSLEYWYLPYNFVSQIRVIGERLQRSQESGFGGALETPDTSHQIPAKIQNNLQIKNVQKFGTSHYAVSVTSNQIPETSNTMGLVALGQGYDDGWQAFAMPADLRFTIYDLRIILPWFFGTKLEHVKVNGWGNGWIVDDEILKQVQDDTVEIIIVYWPQYLQWLGLLLQVGTFGFLGYKLWKKRN